MLGVASWRSWRSFPLKACSSAPPPSVPRPRHRRQKKTKMPIRRYPNLRLGVASEVLRCLLALQRILSPLAFWRSEHLLSDKPTFGGKTEATLAVCVGLTCFALGGPPVLPRTTERNPPPCYIKTNESVTRVVFLRRRACSTSTQTLSPRGFSVPLSV